MVVSMFHNAKMVVIILNLLLATMNKTVDRNWDNMQSRALTSYARAIFRIETMLAHTRNERQELLQSPIWLRLKTTNYIKITPNKATVTMSTQIVFASDL
ncbi:hypothetical protein THRCLA_21483, partial [Thraustotheca clavata]